MMRKAFLCAFIAVCFTITLTYGLKLPITDTEHVDFTEVFISDGGHRDKRSPGGINLPTELELKLNVWGQDTGLQLRKNENIGGRVPIYIQRNGEIREQFVPTRKVSAFYQDVDSGASILYECRQIGDGSCDHAVTGSFLLEKETIMIQPVMDEIADLGIGQQRNVHKVFRPQAYKSSKENPLMPATQSNSKLIFTGIENTSTESQNSDKTHRRKLQKRQLKDVYQLEVLSAVDYSIYDFWYSQSNATTSAGKRLETLENIREFYSFVINAVDMRFETVQSSQISMEIVQAGIFIADSANISEWTENNKVNATPRDTVNVTLAISDFRVWLQQQTSLPEYDHAVAFTGYDLVTQDNSSVTGYTIQEGACDLVTPTSNSIVEDHFDASLAAHTARLLAQNLGVTDDGDGNNCSADDNYVMSPNIGYGDGYNSGNHWTFSSCSSQQLEQKIENLTLSNMNCLMNLTSTHNSSALDQYNSTWPGQLYGIDGQCENAIGSGSYFCRHLYTNYSTLCPAMWCSSADGTNSCEVVVPWEGTTCGNSNWCEAGQCITSNAAPIVDDDCPHDDQPGIVYNSSTCSDLVSSTPASCYNSELVLRCCGSCSSYYTGILGCEYGDRQSGCRSDNCTYYDSYTRDITCCDTCQAYYSSSSTQDYQSSSTTSLNTGSTQFTSSTTDFSATGSTTTTAQTSTTSLVQTTMSNHYTASRNRTISFINQTSALASTTATSSTMSVSTTTTISSTTPTTSTSVTTTSTTTISTPQTTTTTTASSTNQPSTTATTTSTTPTSSLPQTSTTVSNNTTLPTVTTTIENNSAEVKKDKPADNTAVKVGAGVGTASAVTVTGIGAAIIIKKKFFAIANSVAPVV